MACVAILLLSWSWQTNFEKAKTEAKLNHKLILLNFSGSDWCVPCMQMQREIFLKEEFNSFASNHLEVVNADFPRLKKNRLSKELVKQNDALADQYNKEGHFPHTVLLDADGKVLKTWDGYHGENPQTFIQQIEANEGYR